MITMIKTINNILKNYLKPLYSRNHQMAQNSFYSTASIAQTNDIILGPNNIHKQYKISSKYSWKQF